MTADTIVVLCPSCGAHTTPHCNSRTCTWRTCAPCDAYGYWSARTRRWIWRNRKTTP